MLFLNQNKMVNFMEIKVDSVKVQIDKLNAALDGYEDLYLNLYHQLSSLSFFWKDRNAISFCEHLDKEKLQVKNMIDSLKDMKDIYTFMKEKYQVLGNHIVCYLEKKEDVLQSFHNYIAKLDVVIANYKRLDLSFCPKEKVLILEEYHKVKKIRDYVYQLSKNVISTFNQIEEIERKIQVKLSKMKIESLKESDIREFI